MASVMTLGEDSNGHQRHRADLVSGSMTRPVSAVQQPYEGLRVSLAGAEDKLAQVDALAERQLAAVQLGMPGFSRSAGTAGTPRPTS